MNRSLTPAALAAVLLLGALPLAGCELFATPGEEPVAAGPIRAVAGAATAARRCGVRDTRLVPVAGRRAVLRMGQNHAPDAEACLRSWIANHEDRFDKALLERSKTA